jgi:dipeptidyl-peptidase-3
MSNYHSFGHFKFVPEISEASFKSILESHPSYLDAASFYNKTVFKLWPLVKKELKALEKPYTQINYPEDGGITGYFSPNMKKADLELVKAFLNEQKIDALNTRAFKKANGSFEISVGSIDVKETEVTFKGVNFKVKYGEFAEYLKEVNYYLEKAKTYAANDN